MPFVTPRRSFLKTFALAGATLPLGWRASSGADNRKPKSCQMQNQFFGVQCDLDSGQWHIWRKEDPLLLNAVSRAILGHGTRETTDSDYRRTIQLKKVSAPASAGQELVMRCVDGKRQLDFELRITIEDQRERILIETLCRNISREPIVIQNIELLSTLSSGGGGFWPGTSKVLTNGQMYYDAGRVLDFKGDKTIRSWWNLAFVPGEDREGLVVGYLENHSSQGRLYATPRNDDSGTGFELVANSTFQKECVLLPGHEITSDRLLFNIGANPFVALESYAQAIGDVHKVKLNRPINGWCSWFSFFGSITEDEVVRTAGFAAGHLKPLGFEYIQVDDGFYRAFGDWEGNARFPHGMKWLAEKIKGLGLKPGIWLAPYAIAEGTDVHKSHPDWLIRHPNGHLKQIGPGLVEGSKEAEAQKPKVYALDISHPEAAAWLRSLFHTVSHVWGYEFIKIDFVEWSLLAAERYHDPTVTKAAIYRRGAEIMREAMGPDRHLLECGPGNVSVGLIDSMRIELDQPPVTWQQYYLHPASSAPAAAKRYYFHNRTWINDNDHVVLAHLTPGQSQAAATIVSLCGGNMMAGDRLSDLDTTRLEILKKVFPSFGEAARPIDLFESDKPEIFALQVKKPFAEWLVLGIFNGDPASPKTKTIVRSRLGLDSAKNYVAFDFWNQKFFGELNETFSVRLEPASVLLLAIHEKRAFPQLLSTDRHVSQGGIELEKVQWDGDARTLTGISLGGRGTTHNVYIYLPEKHPWEQRDLFFAHDFPGYTLALVEDQILRVRVDFTHSERILWEIQFDKFWRL